MPCLWKGSELRELCPAVSSRQFTCRGRVPQGSQAVWQAGQEGGPLGGAFRQPRGAIRLLLCRACHLGLLLLCSHGHHVVFQAPAYAKPRVSVGLCSGMCLPVREAVV